MCHTSCLNFIKNVLTEDVINGKRVMEIGSRIVTPDYNYRPLLEALKPKEYIGIDIEDGFGVDIKMSASDIVSRFGEESFDVIICAQTLEHVRDWIGAVNNIQAACKKGGVILVTAPSYGVSLHRHPQDYWRFRKEDFQYIFSDFDILRIEKDTDLSGVLLFAKRPETDVRVVHMFSGYSLYNVIFDKYMTQQEFESIVSLNRLAEKKGITSWKDV